MGRLERFVPVYRYFLLILKLFWQILNPLRINLKHTIINEQFIYDLILIFEHVFVCLIYISLSLFRNKFYSLKQELYRCSKFLRVLFRKYDVLINPTVYGLILWLKTENPIYRCQRTYSCHYIISTRLETPTPLLLHY